MPHTTSVDLPGPLLRAQQEPRAMPGLPPDFILLDVPAAQR